MDAMNWIQTHGTITCGTEQMHVAWPCLCHVFSVHCENDASCWWIHLLRYVMDLVPPVTCCSCSLWICLL
jgi:hypothetical protein